MAASNKSTFMIEYIQDKKSEVCSMKHVYVEFADETLVTFNDIRLDKNVEHIDVYFERPIDGGFAFLQISLPDLDTVATEGMTDAEIRELKDFAVDNEALIWEMAREGGNKIANVRFISKSVTYDKFF